MRSELKPAADCSCCGYWPISRATLLDARLPGQCNAALTGTHEVKPGGAVQACHIEPPRGSELLRRRRMAGLAIGGFPAVHCHFLPNMCGGLAWPWVAFVWILCAASQCRTGEIGIAGRWYEARALRSGGLLHRADGTESGRDLDPVSDREQRRSEY